MPKRVLTTTLALRAGCAAVLLCAALSAPAAHAYSKYDNGSGSGCVSCHSGFSGGNPSLLHIRHQYDFGITQCNLCHPSGGGTKPVLTYNSGAGGGYGCAGCHGRDYGETSPNSGAPKSTAYGLRQLHMDKGWATNCGTANCHKPGSLGHPDPFPAILPESVPPPYYGTGTNNLKNPCDSTQEDSLMDVDTVGLDNDGNGAADWPDDLNCAEPTTTTTTTTLPVSCEPTPSTGCVTADGGKVLVDEKKTGKEKLKITLKKFASAVDQAMFGNPLPAAGTSYAVCIYDVSNVLLDSLSVANAGDSCGSPPKPCWQAVSDKGYKYLDKLLTEDGIQKMQFVGGSVGKGKVVANGKNDAPNGKDSLPVGVAAALQNATEATVQVLTSNASCFEMKAAKVSKADGLTFKASVP